MTPAEFDYLRIILRERSGLNLAEDRRELLEGRLRPLLKEFRFDSISDLANAAMRPDGEYLRVRLAQAATVQESYFFRDKLPFHYLEKTVLPELIAARGASRRIRIWCAAAATGQEPYSLAMLFAEKSLELDAWNIEIVATDYAKDALAKARVGLYSQFEVQRGLPVSLLVKYFTKTDRWWEISPQIRSMVRFQEYNLLADAAELGTFDLILCRNVLIYFDDEIKRKVLATLASALAPDGTLMLGSAETTTGLNKEFVAASPQHRGIFTFTPSAMAERLVRYSSRAADRNAVTQSLARAAR